MAQVLVVLNRPLTAEYKRHVAATQRHSHQVFELAINGTC